VIELSTKQEVPLYSKISIVKLFPLSDAIITSVKLSSSISFKRKKQIVWKKALERRLHEFKVKDKYGKEIRIYRHDTINEAYFLLLQCALKKINNDGNDIIYPLITKENIQQINDNIIEEENKKIEGTNELINKKDGFNNFQNITTSNKKRICMKIIQIVVKFIIFPFIQQ